MPVDRWLSYDDRFVYQLVETVDTAITSETPLATFPDDSTEIALTVLWTQEQYTRILSALTVGADLVYPYQAQQIYYDFLKLSNAMTCETIIDCIQNDPDTALAIQQFLTQNGYGTGSGTYDEPTIYTLNPMLADGSAISGCNNDNLFGAITQLVDLMNSILSDIFEKIEVASNYLERTSLLVSGAPALGLLPIDEFVECIDQIISALAENYASQYTLTIRDEYRCDLFCLCKDTCEMDFHAWSDYFMGKVGAVISTENLSDGIEWLITGVWEGEQVVHAAHALMCDILAYGSEFFGVDMSWLSRSITAAMNDPDSDWTTLCEDCPDEAFIAVISEAPCNDWGRTCGTIVGQQSTFVWRISSTHDTPSNGEGASIADAEGRSFRVTGATVVSGGAIFSYSLSNTLCATSNGFGNGFLNVDLKNLFLLRQNGNIWTIDFTVELSA